MRRVGLAALLLLTACAALAMEDFSPLSDPVKDERYHSLTKEFRCLQCQGETVADTPARFAVEIRRQVREMVEAGRTDDEIRQFMVERYGETITYRPLVNAANAWLWLAPGVFLIGGAYAGWRILRQRRELLASDTSEVTDEVERS